MTTSDLGCLMWCLFEKDEVDPIFSGCVGQGEPLEEEIGVLGLRDRSKELGLRLNVGLLFFKVW